MAKFRKELVPVDEVRRYIRAMGAPTIKEMKEYFEVDSRSMRRSLARVMFKEDVNLVVMGGMPPGTTYWFEWPSDKRGKPSPQKMRAEAKKKREKAEARRLRPKRSSAVVEVDFEEE